MFWQIRYSKSKEFSVILHKKHLLRDLVSNMPNYCSFHVDKFHGYLFTGMRDRRMQSRAELAGEIQLTDWSAAGNLSNRSSRVQILHDICTHFGHYLYSTKCSWIIKANTAFCNIFALPPGITIHIRDFLAVLNIRDMASKQIPFFTLQYYFFQFWYHFWGPVRVNSDRQHEGGEMTTNDKPLDEIPTATCEPSEIATWKGLHFRWRL